MKWIHLERAVNAAVILGIGVLVAVLLGAWVLPPASGAIDGPVDYAAANASHDDCLRVLDVVGAEYVDAAVQARDLGVLLDAAETRIDRQAATIARLRERLANR